MPTEYNGHYGLDCQNIFLEGNRAIFEKDGKCVWWHRQYRHWWIGPCENVGWNAGYAYAEEDFDCPDLEQTWRRGGSNEILHGACVLVEQLTPAVEDVSSTSYSSQFHSGEKPASNSDGYAPKQTSATVGVNAVIRNGRYKQICRPVYRNGRFRCP
jgi:hypothetical protein